MGARATHGRTGYSGGGSLVARGWPGDDRVRPGDGPGSRVARRDGIRGDVTPRGYNVPMGKNNRQRRAAKARQRPRKRPWPRPAANGPGLAPWSQPRFSAVSERFIAAVYARQSGDEALVHRVVDALARERADGVATEVAGVLEQQVAYSWSQGWQPADLQRAADRLLTRLGPTIVRRAIAAEAAGYEALGDRAAPGWMAQLDSIGATRDWDRDRPYLCQLDSPWPEVLLAAVGVLGLLFRLPALPRLTDPPSAWSTGDAQPGRSLPGGVLEKVRALLAKAESTTFDAEAEAFTAKAQELMARHRIDRAVLEADGHTERDEPVGRRIGVTDPYADAKALLLGGVADANGCRAVWSKTLGFTTVFGFADELDGVEELFTSLLVQATGALRREGSKVDRTGASRTTRFRRSFLVAFAARVGQRLHDAVHETVEAASAETGAALVPMLAARDEAADAAATAAFPEMGSFSPSASDHEGWYKGTLFGDQAQLALGPELSQRPA